MPEAKRVTLKLIAEKAGTSIGTVDRALKDRQGIRNVTRERVLAAARDLGYMPNSAASVLRRMASMRLGFVYPEQPAPFFAPVTAGINDAVADYGALGIEVTHIRYSQQNENMEADTLQKIRPSEFQGIAVNSAGPGIAREINRLSDAGVPVITFNTDAANSRRLFFIGNDAIQSGRIGAALLGRYLGGKGALTILGNFIQTTPFSERFGGFCETIHQEFPDMMLYPCAECCTEKRLASQSLMCLLQSVPQVRGVFCTSYTSTVGAIHALKQLNRQDITLIGHDTSEELLQALQEGWCDALLFQDPYRQGYAAVQTLAQFVLDRKMPDTRKTNILTSIVIPQNVGSYR